jgi:hypothetical protein
MIREAMQNWKQISAAIVAVFLAWSLTDFLLHGVLLMPTYQATAQLWRPLEDMKNWLLSLVTLIAAGGFVKIYALLCSPKSLGRGTFFGLLWGVVAGVSMGYGTYAVMPLPYHLALSWFLGTAVQGVLGGLLIGAIVRDRPAAV